MSRKFTRQETIDSAIGAFHKLSNAAGIDTKRLEESIRRSRSTDVEKGKPEVREEAKQILEQALVKKSKSEEEGEVEETEETEKPSLNNAHVKEILKAFNDERKKEPNVADLIGRLMIGIPLAALFIYIGYVHLEDCPVAKLSSWLLVIGILWAVQTLIVTLSFIAFKLKWTVVVEVFSSIYRLAATASLLWGFYGISLIWGHWSSYSEDPESPQYCDWSVMMISKTVIAISVIGWAMLVCCCGCLACILFCGR